MLFPVRPQSGLPLETPLGRHREVGLVLVTWLAGRLRAFCRRQPSESLHCGTKPQGWRIRRSFADLPSDLVPNGA